METRAETLATFADGAPALVAQDNYHYPACWPDVSALGMLMALLRRKAALATIELPTEVRLRRRGDLSFGRKAHDVDDSVRSEALTQFG